MSSHLKLGSGNHLLRNAAGHLVIECASVEPTCDIDTDTMASAYTVQGVDSLTGCASCSTKASSPAWSGILLYTGYGDWMLYEDASVAGKEPSYSGGVGADCSPYGPNGVGIWYNRALCQWELAITCRDTYNYYVIWAGTKSVEFSPAGVYTRVCGCDETPILTVV